MNISQTFIERPIATSLLMAAIALFGGVAYRALAVSDLPNVDLPTLLVTASLPGASPETMAPTLPLWTLDEYAETRVAQRISMVTGVAQVQVLGAQKFAVHAQMDPHAMAARQVGINEVETALKNWNVNLPTGTINGPKRAFTLQASGQLMSAAQYRPLVVAYRKGSPVRLEELGSVVDGVEDDKTASWFYKKEGDQRSVILGIQRQPGTNTMEVSNGIKGLLPV